MGRSEFVSPVLWNRFDFNLWDGKFKEARVLWNTPEGPDHTWITDGPLTNERGKVLTSSDFATHYTTTRAGPWVDCRGSASGTVTLLTEDGMADVGIIVIPHPQAGWEDVNFFERDINKHMADSGIAWFYNEAGVIFHYYGRRRKTVSCGLRNFDTLSNTITVKLQRGTLTFAMNGVEQGAPIPIGDMLPEGYQVAMAVSLVNTKVRIT